VDVTNGSYLTKAEIDGADEMSVPLARKMFSDWAVTLLREQGELRTADFAEHMRMYFDSCDTRGFNLQGRKVMWEKIYRWLMEMQDIFDTGPYIGVLTRTSWESMCCTLTAFRQMCEYLQEYLPSSYEKFNLRAVNNDMCEHFFSCMGFQTVKNWQKKYHAAKVEADKRFAEERGELGYRMPKPRKNTGNAALPFNDPAVLGRKRKGGKIVNGCEYVKKRIKTEYIGKRETGDSRAKPLRDLAGSKTNCATLIPHGVKSTVSLEAIRNQEGELVFTKKTAEEAKRLRDSGADEETVEQNTPQNTQEWLGYREHLPGKPGQRPTGGSSIWERCGGKGPAALKRRIKYEAGQGEAHGPVSPALQKLFDYGHRHEEDGLAPLIAKGVPPLSLSLFFFFFCIFLCASGASSNYNWRHLTFEVVCIAGPPPSISRYPCRGLRHYSSQGDSRGDQLVPGHQP